MEPTCPIRMILPGRESCARALERQVGIPVDGQRGVGAGAIRNGRTLRPGEPVAVGGRRSLVRADGTAQARLR